MIILDTNVLIDVHASFLNLPLATADLNLYQTYFPEIKLLSPPATVES